MGLMRNYEIQTITITRANLTKKTDISTHLQREYPTLHILVFPVNQLSNPKSCWMLPFTLLKAIKHSQGKKQLTYIQLVLLPWREPRSACLLHNLFPLFSFLSISVLLHLFPSLPFSLKYYSITFSSL